MNQVVFILKFFSCTDLREIEFVIFLW